MRLTLALALLSTVSTAVAAQPDAEGFVPLFNGRDLSGWVNANCAPETWSVKEGRIVCTGRPIGTLRTARQYENFILEFEWRHLTSGGNSGMFVWATPISAPGVPFLRGIEIQALDHGYAVEFEKKNGKKADWFTVHGDVFPIHGATMTPIGKTNGKRSFPSEERSRPSPEWNHYRLVARDGTLRLHVNRKEVSGGNDCNYRKGYLGLESEGAPVEFRNLRIKELPSSGAGPDVSAPVDPGWRPLFTGLDLRGWRAPAPVAARWSVLGERLTLKPADAVAGADATLWSEGDFGAAEFVLDFQPAKNARGDALTATLLVRGQDGRGTPVTLAAREAGKYTRFTVTVKDGSIRLQRDGDSAQELPLPATAPRRGAIGLVAGAGAGQFMNLHAREL